MVKTGPHIVLLLALCSAVAWSQDVRLSARTDSDTFVLGSWIDIHVNGQWNAAVDTIGPAATDSLGAFGVVNIERSGVEPQWTVRVMSIDSGKIFLPPIEFDYRLKGDTLTRKAYTNSLLLNLTGIAYNPQGDIKDIKSPMSAPWLFEDYLPYLIGLVVISVLTALVPLYLRKKKRKKDLFAGVKVIIPPHREALTALRTLEEKKLWQQGSVKEYYSEITEIIRHFFEQRWNIVALELTTDEILEQMKHLPDALMVWNEMQSFFETADLTKFAKHQPAPADHENEMRVAYEIVRAMTPRAPLEPAEQSQEATADAR